MAFFYKILHHSRINESFPNQELASLEKELIGITADELGILKLDVVSHEHLLSSVLMNDSPTGLEEYRAKHRGLLVKMFDLEARIRDFKMRVFSDVKRY